MFSCEAKELNGETFRLQTSEILRSTISVSDFAQRRITRSDTDSKEDFLTCSMLTTAMASCVERFS
ncbi:hypothetical protein DM992_11080 [Burkholderia sp. JP2-270]|nr:hypothetical protein DM992_11080 [Burkholderia sp. JP2-270]